MSMKVRRAIKLSRADGWYLVVPRVSHRQFKHLDKTGRVTVAGKPGDDIAPGTWASIKKQAGIEN